jgi:hypothetical protein
MYTNVKIVKQQLASLPKNNSILDWLRYINKLTINPLILNLVPYLLNPIFAEPLTEPLECNFNNDI